MLCCALLGRFDNGFPATPSFGPFPGAMEEAILGEIKDGRGEEGGGWFGTERAPPLGYPVATTSSRTAVWRQSSRCGLLPH